MAASTQQKLDYLLKKIGYTASKTGLAEDSVLSGTKKAPFAESIPSPLVTASSSIWAESNNIPGTPPGSDSSYVKVYLAGTSGHRMTVDSTVSGSRAFIAYSTYNNTSTAILGDWIDTQFGDSYIIKVYKGDPNSGGTLLSAAGSGSNDTWFFDYSSGVLNFNGTVVPSGVTDTNIYIVGYRYIGAKGTSTAGINTEGTSIFENITVDGNAGIGSLNVTGVSTFAGHVGLTTSLNVTGIATFNDNMWLGTTGYDQIHVGGRFATHLLTYVNDGYDLGSSTEGWKNLFLTGNAGIGSLNVTGVSTLGITSTTWLEAEQLSVSGVSTFSSTVTMSNTLDFGTNKLIKGESDGLKIETFGTQDLVINSNHGGGTDGDIILKTGSTEVLKVNGSGDIIVGSGISVVGVSTFVGAIDANGDLDVDGHTELDNVNVSGVSTFAGLVYFDGGEVRLGNSSSDMITGSGLFQRDITPSSSGDRTLGESTNEWQTLFSQQLKISGISTLGITSATWLEAEQLNVSGISTLNDVSINAGVVTFTNVSSAPSDSLAGGHIYSYDNGLRIVGGSGALQFHSAGFQRWKIGTDGTFAPLSTAGLDIGSTLYPVSNLIVSANAGIGSLNVTGVSTLGVTSTTWLEAEQLNVTGVSTFTGAIDANGNLDVDGYTELDQVNVSAASTFGGLVDIDAGAQANTLKVEDLTDNRIVIAGTGGELEDTTKLTFDGSTFAVVGDATFSGNVTIGGTLTKEDVTNIDSVGLITAQSGVRVTAGGLIVTSGVSTFSDSAYFPDNSKINFGDATSPDLQIYHSGSHTYIKDSGTGALVVNSDDFYVNNAADNETLIRAQEDVGVKLYDGTNTKRFETTSTGSIVTGILTATSFTGTLNTAAQTNITSVGTLTSLDVSGSITGAGDLTLTDTTADSAAGPELKLFRNSASPADADYLGQIKFAGESDTGVERNYAKITGKIGDASNTSEDGILEFAHIKAGSQVITGRWNSTTLQLINDTALSVAGDITANGNITGDSATIISGISTVGATTYYGSGAHLTGIVTATGISTAGTSTFENITVDGNAGIGSLNVTGVSTFTGTITANGTANFNGNVDLGNSGTDTITPNGRFDADILPHIDNNQYYRLGTPGYRWYRAHFGTGGVKIDDGGINVGGGLTVTGISTLGITSTTWLEAEQLSVSGLSTFKDNIKLINNKELLIGDSGDIQIGYEGGVIPYIRTNKLRLQSVTGTEDYIAADVGAGVSIYHDNSLKFQTVGVGVTVFGNTETQTLNVTGVSTFAGAIDANAGIDLPDSTKVRLGTGNDFEIYFNGADSYLRNEGGANFVIVNSTSGTIEMDPGGGKVQIKNDLEIADKIIHTGDTNTAIRFPTADTITAETGGSERLRIDSSGNVGIGTDTPTDPATALNTTVTSAGIVTAYRFYGDGSNLTGTGGETLISGITVQEESSTIGTAGSITTLDFQGATVTASASGSNKAVITLAGAGATDAWIADSQENLVAGTGAGASRDSDTLGNIAIGSSSAALLNAGDYNVSIGTSAGVNMTSGLSNVVIGHCAAYHSSGSSHRNIYMGQEAGKCKQGGGSNIGLGLYALYGSSTPGNNTSSGNIALGECAGKANTSGSYNLLFGRSAGENTTTGSCNVIIGSFAAGSGTITSQYNIIFGKEAAKNITSGGDNIIGGYRAVGSGVLTGSYNAIFGREAGCSLTSGSDNFIYGRRAACGATSIQNNIIIGYLAASGATLTGNQNILLGTNVAKNLTGAYNVMFGLQSGCQLGNANHNVFVGHYTAKNNTGNMCYSVAIGHKTDLPITAGNTQLAIGCNGSYWMVGNSSFNVGIGTTNPDAPVGSNNEKRLAVGILSAYQLYGDGANLTNLPTGITTTGTSTFENIVVNGNAGIGSLNVTGVSTLGITSATWLEAEQVKVTGVSTFSDSIGLAVDKFINLKNSSDATKFSIRHQNSGETTFNNTQSGSNVQFLNSTNSDAAFEFRVKYGYGAASGFDLNGDGHLVPAADSASDLGLTGTRWRNVYADTLYGDGSNLSGVGWSPDDQENLWAGTFAGTASDADTCYNIGIGYSAGNALNEGDYNVLLGHKAGTVITDGGSNVAIGRRAALSMTSGSCNIALGFCALSTETLGTGNIAIGKEAGMCAMPDATCTGDNNVFIGTQAGKYANRQQWSCSNIAIGYRAGYKASYNCNVFIGNEAGLCNQGFSNVFMGETAGRTSTGSYNIFFGRAAGCKAGSGGCNIGMGFCALLCLTNGCDNIGIGACDTLKCTSSGNHNIGLGKAAGCKITTGCCNITIGCRAGECITTGHNNIAIGVSVQVPNPTGNAQLAIGVGNTFWINGNANWNVGIGTTNPDISVGVGNTAVLAVGIVSAYKLYGDGACLTNVGAAATNAWAADSQENLVAGNGAGAARDADTCFNIMIGCSAGAALNQGDHNILLGCKSGNALTAGQYNVLIGENAGLLETDSQNVYIGRNAGKCATSGEDNVFLGTTAGRGNATSGVTGEDNVAVGNAGLTNLSSGSFNVALGNMAGYEYTTATHSISIGCKAAYCRRTGNNNIAIGEKALCGSNTVGDNTGAGNIAIGKDAGCETTSGSNNFFGGYSAGGCNETGSYNVLFGLAAGKTATSGNYRVFLGNLAGDRATGTDGIFIGSYTGRCNTGTYNIAIGRNALTGSSTPGDNTGLKNIAIGCDAGLDLTTGSCNVLMGTRAGYNITSGSHYVAIGNNALGTEDTGGSGAIAIGKDALAVQNGAWSNNVAIGYEAGATLTEATENVFMGYNAGKGVTTGCRVVALGSLTLTASTTGGDNVVIGGDTGRNNTGSSNVLIGACAGRTSGDGSSNTILGHNAGGAVTNGDKNSFLGACAGDAVTTGCCNVAIGHGADVASATGNNQLAIGIAANNWITGDSSYNTTVNDISASNFNSTSDIRLKTNIQPIGDPIGKVKQIEGVSFNWKKDNKPALGVIADQVEKILPELVHGDDPKTVNYNGLIGLLIETVKEQQNQIDELNDRISKLE